MWKLLLPAEYNECVQEQTNTLCMLQHKVHVELHMFEHMCLTGSW